MVSVKLPMNTDSTVASNDAASAREEEIEVTPEMIEAGINAYCEWDSRFEETEGLVWQIYEAMELARREPSRVAPRSTQMG
jgi:hypothetical protein